MKTNTSKSATALDSANLTELTSQDARRISGGNESVTNGVWAGEDGKGTCTPPFFPPFIMTYPRG